jgi:hypothetical protein
MRDHKHVPCVRQHLLFVSHSLFSSLPSPKPKVPQAFNKDIAEGGAGYFTRELESLSCEPRHNLTQDADADARAAQPQQKKKQKNK